MHVLDKQQKTLLTKEESMEAKNDKNIGAINIKEAAIFLNEKVSYLRSLVLHKKIPHFKVGRALRFLKSDLIEWYQTKRVHTNKTQSGGN